MRFGWKLRAQTLVLAAALFGQIAGAADNAAPKYLTGRLEQISGTGAQLPVQLSIPTLKTMTPKVDKSVLPPSYPSYMLGKWGGQLQIVVSWHDPTLGDDPMLMKGTVGTTIFNFQKTTNDVVLKPATIFLPPTQARLGDNLMPSNEVEDMRRVAAMRHEQLDSNKPVNVFGIICLGSSSMTKLDGSSTQSVVTHNSLKTLKPGVVEQDSIVKQTGSDGLSYTEFVTRFTWYGPNKVWAQVGRVSYGAERQALRQTVLQGWITSNWQDYAQQIAKQCNRPWDYLEREYNI